MKKNILIMLLISSLISLNGYGQQFIIFNFAFESNGTTFKLGEKTKIFEGYKTRIIPKVKKSDGSETDEIEIGTEYKINSNTRYTVYIRRLLSQQPPGIYSLDVRGNNLKILEIPNEAGYLETLYCQNNQLKSVDFADSENLKKNLKIFNCAKNLIESIDLHEFKNLTDLRCYNNKLTSLDVKGLDNLETIYCDHNMFDACALDDLFLSLPKKNDANKGDIFIADKDGGKELYTKCATKIATDKNWLVYDYNGNNKKIIEGNGTGCQRFTFSSYGTKFKIDKQTAHSGIIKIKPGIGGADESTLVKDTEYTIEQNTTYTVTGSFKELVLWKNILNSLDVSGLKSLERLWCRNNRIKSLNLTGLTKLTSLHCGNNKLYSLDVSSLKSLKELGCDQNYLKKLDLTGLKDLGSVICELNWFDACALDEIFKTLPHRKESDNATISIYDYFYDYENDPDQGYYNDYYDDIYKCRTELANEINWTVGCYSQEDFESITNSEPYGCEEDNSIPENLASELDIKVFPNPVRDALQIESEEVIKQVSVFDISGKLLIKELVNDINFNLLTTDLYSGIYVLRIQTDKGISNIKVIKE